MTLSPHRLREEPTRPGAEDGQTHFAARVEVRVECDGSAAGCDQFDVGWIQRVIAGEPEGSALVRSELDQLSTTHLNTK